ncbi:MAG: hypothetical protein OXR66_09730 [Candidatus Woesearchaeota archaeon]|nr:hypothetical protein [Candidatus Woesearchaeota archaeon]
MKLIPTVLAYDKKEFTRLFKKITSATNDIQVDFMDGRFVDTKSITLEQAPSVKKYKKKRFEAHIMVAEPMPWAVELLRKGYTRILFHYEAMDPEDIRRGCKLIRKLGGKALLALNPSTPVKKILPHLDDVDGILFLGVVPGQNGAPYVQETPQRIKELRKHYSGEIQVDGGMTDATIHDVVAAGATRVNSGSFVSNAADPKAAISRLQAAARGE